MLIPCSMSDAPIHYAPWGTISLVVANVLFFLLHISGQINPASFDAYWVLHYSDQDFHIIQIVSSMFAHADWGHLIGNMIFLWIFALVVEGKLGWKQFLPLYFAMGISINILELFWVSNTHEGSLGASSVIYALMVCALFWAPRNEVDCLFIFFPYVRKISLSILALVCWFIGWDIFSALLLGFDNSSTPLLHTLGAIVGFFPAYFMLKWELVNCEGWDLFTIRKNGRPDPSKKWHNNNKPETQSIYDKEIERQALRQEFRNLLQQQKPLLALAVYNKGQEKFTGLALDKQERYNFICALIRNKHIEEARSLLEQYIQDYDRDTKAHLQLAKLYIDGFHDLKRGMTTLNKLNGAYLNDAERRYAYDLRQRAIRPQSHKVIA